MDKLFITLLKKYLKIAILLAQKIIGMVLTYFIGKDLE